MHGKHEKDGSNSNQLVINIYFSLSLTHTLPFLFAAGAVWRLFLTHTHTHHLPFFSGAFRGLFLKHTYPPTLVFWLQVPFGGWAMWLAGDLPVHFTRDARGWGVKKGTVRACVWVGG